MTTKRNNMFHDRGFIGAINLALCAIKEYGDIDKVKDFLLKFKDSRAKWITDCTPGFTRSSIETKSLITNHYFVTVKDNKYILLNRHESNKIDRVILWSEDTSTQCIIDIYGDDSVIEFIDNDLNFQDNIASLINIADDYELIDKLKTIIITDLYTDIYN